MSRTGEHRVIIRRRGRSHRATCSCGWAGHAWNELRPAQADAWDHVFGDETIVDISAIPGPGDSPAVLPAHREDRRTVSADTLARRARDLAGTPSPYGRQAAASELWHLAFQDKGALQEAILEVEELLAAHSRRSASTADGEWLQLITAKRLLEESLRQEAIGSYL